MEDTSHEMPVPPENPAEPDPRYTRKRELQDRLKKLADRSCNYPDPRNHEYDLYLGFQWKPFFLGGGEVGMTQDWKSVKGFPFCCFFV